MVQRQVCSFGISPVGCIDECKGIRLTMVMSRVYYILLYPYILVPKIL